MTSTNITQGPIRGAGFLLAAFATLGLPCLAQTQTEGFDPLRLITVLGDYATSAPLSGVGAAASNIVMVTSSDFPSWEGHLYAYDSAVTKAAYDHNHILCYQWLTSCYGGNTTSNATNPCIPCLKWDAGYVLSNALMPDGTTATPGYKTPAQRSIYTWDPANSNALVEVIATNLTTLQSIVPTLTAAHVDFIRGNNGTGTARAWNLGPIINSTPALIASPLQYSQGTVDPSHLQFRLNQGARNPVLWVGSDDGMLHGFNLSNGGEQVALLPPSLLAAQVTLYNNYTNPGGTVTGQLPNTTSHIYGVANSLRFADVYFSSTTPATFKTVGFLTLGPGGSELTAIDLTHPSPGDTGYGFGSLSNPPVQILWRLTDPSLFKTWSVPALAPSDVSNHYVLLVGGGFNSANTAVTQQTNNSGFLDPVFFALDPTDGTQFNNGNPTKSFTMTSTGKTNPLPLVGSQAFADSVLLQTTAKYYQEDNVADLGLQADLNGRIWFAHGAHNKLFSNGDIGIDLTKVVTTNQQPIYYPPAASGYRLGSAGCDVFAFASGTLYERSASVSGSGIGTSPAFEPSLYVATAQKATPPIVSTSTIFRQQIKNLTAPTCPTPPDPSQPPCIVDPNAGNKLNARSQVTAPPYLLIPRSGKGISKAFFLVDDPTNGGNGFSYVVELDVTPGANCTLPPTNVTPTVYGASLGAASGFIITDNIVRVAKSGIGGAPATIATVPGVTPASGGTISLVPQWWRKLK